MTNKPADTEGRSDRRRLLSCAIVSLCLAVGLGWLGQFFWLFDLFSHFQLQYLLFACVGFVLCIVQRRWICLAITAAIIVLTTLTLAPSWPGKDADRQPAITVMQFNRFFLNHDPQPLAKFLAKADPLPDILTLQEVTKGDLARFRSRIASFYPYSYPERIYRQSDVVIFSRHPLAKRGMVGVGAGRFALHVDIQPPGFPQPVRIYSFHTASPGTASLTRQRDHTLDHLARIIASDRAPYLLLAGDLNTTPYNHAFRAFLRQSGLSHAYAGLPPATWPAHFGIAPLMIPIDHVLFKPSLAMVDYRAGPALGSDHRALLARLSPVAPVR